MGIAGVAATLLLAGTIAFAEEQSTDSVRGMRPTSIKEVREKRTMTMTASTTRAEREKDTQERIQKVREEMQTKVTALREKAAQRLADIQDKKKKELADRLVKKFDNLNETWTDHFMKELDHYDAVLQKIQDRADIAAGKGNDVSSVTTAIQSATTAIESARTLVTAQAAKTYTPDTSSITVTTATTTPNGQSELMKALRTSFQNLHNTLFKDLFALRDGAMKDARKAVQNALQVLKSVPRVDDDDSETSTSTPSSNQ